MALSVKYEPIKINNTVYVIEGVTLSPLLVLIIFEVMESWHNRHSQLYIIFKCHISTTKEIEYKH